MRKINLKKIGIFDVVYIVKENGLVEETTTHIIRYGDHTITLAIYMEDDCFKVNFNNHYKCEDGIPSQNLTSNIKMLFFKEKNAEEYSTNLLIARAENIIKQNNKIRITLDRFKKSTEK